MTISLLNESIKEGKLTTGNSRVLKASDAMFPLFQSDLR